MTSGSEILATPKATLRTALASCGRESWYQEAQRIYAEISNLHAFLQVQSDTEGVHDKPAAVLHPMVSEP